jgi:DNA polymerase
MKKAEKLVELERKCHACRKCLIGGQLIDGHLSNVFSNMCVKANLMVVGQNPGDVEVKLGTPFVGPSGAFFDRALKDVLDTDRSKLYISNVVRCLTPGNRPPKQVEIDNCQEFLEVEIEIIKPELIVTLGSPALKQVTGISGIMKCHGEIQMSPRYGLPVLPLLHPSPLNMNKSNKKQMFLADLEILKDYLNGR